MGVQHQPQRDANEYCGENPPTAKTTRCSYDQCSQLYHRQHEIVRGSQRLAKCHLLHLIQALKQSQWSPDNTQNTEDKASNTEDQHRVFEAMYQMVQTRQAPHCHHPRSDSNGSNDRAAEDIDQMHLRIVRNGQRKVGMKEQAGGE